jgi:hypothetical protein
MCAMEMSDVTSPSLSTELFCSEAETRLRGNNVSGSQMHSSTSSTAKSIVTWIAIQYWLTVAKKPPTIKHKGQLIFNVGFERNILT